MKHKILYPLISLLLGIFISYNASGQLPEGSKPAPTNIRADQYPCILTDLKVVFKVTAPEAGKLQVDLLTNPGSFNNKLNVFYISVG